MIEITDVSAAYGDVQALDGVSLSVGRGESVGVFGTNGAGKTTLFKLLVGLNRPDEGTVRVAGADPADGNRVRELVRYLPEHAGFPANLTGREVLRFHARVRGVPADGRDHHVRRILATVGLADAADRRVGGYSNGMNRRLGLGTALVGDPAVLILDEPTAGLDPDGIAAFHDVVGGLADRTDVTVLFSSHALSEIERLCDRAVLMNDGRVAADGPVERLRRSGDTVTVSLALPGPEAAAAAARLLRERAAVAAVSQRGTRVTADCPPGEAYDALVAVGEAHPLERFEVTEPGLEAAFHEAVGGTEDDGTRPERPAGTGGETA
ncbi:ABC transporter ATP-binding protein [Haloglomus salinum]|jgi:Cu-processing system ATP-binding protein|uniref:ABC transporter ATP-binding protein n=1 Tax=Haloglomus salinum TaxID=2962673 RepID=UPI0020C9C238|nr:ABC transporter ATP-binding protein [Haloglomus salinum]